MKRLLAIALWLAMPAWADADPMMPDPALTPGAWNDPPTDLALICDPTHVRLSRHVSGSLKREVLRRYGYDPHNMRRQDYEIDHLVPLELDGSNAIENLWPESYVTEPWNAHRKDVLENTLHRMVCRHELDLRVAQQAIAKDWIAAYQQYVLHDQ